MSPQVQSSISMPTASDQQAQYVDEPAIIVYTNTLAASGPGSILTATPVPVDRDADFLLVAINGSAVGSYLINLQLPSGRQIASSPMQNANFVSEDPQQPTAIGPPALYRAGSNGPVLYLQNTSNASNAIELELSGIRRIRTA